MTKRPLLVEALSSAQCIPMDVRFTLNHQVRSEYTYLLILLRRHGIQDKNIIRLMSSYLVTSLEDMGFHRVRFIQGARCTAVRGGDESCTGCKYHMRLNKAQTHHYGVQLCVNCKSGNSTNGGCFVRSFFCGACATWYAMGDLKRYWARHRSSVPADLSTYKWEEIDTCVDFQEQNRRKYRKLG